MIPTIKAFGTCGDFTPFNGDPAKLASLVVNPKRIRVLAPGEPFILTRLTSK